MTLLTLISGPCIVKNDLDIICNFCIAVMSTLAKNLGMTYGAANVWLFVILMPLIIVLFFLAALFKRKNVFAKVCFYMGIVIVAIIILVLMQAFADTILSVKDQSVIFEIRYTLESCLIATSNQATFLQKLG